MDVEKVAGFSLNVSNYNKTEDEVKYAESVRSELTKLGVTDSHYVIDISRNGAGAQDRQLQSAEGPDRTCAAAVPRWRTRWPSVGEESGRNRRTHAGVARQSGSGHVPR